MVFGVALFILKRQKEIRERIAHLNFNIYVYVCINVQCTFETFYILEKVARAL